MERRGFWRACPAELKVPVLIGALLQVILTLVPRSGPGVMAGTTIALFGAAATSRILVLCGLIERRRRAEGRARIWLLVACVSVVLTILEVVGVSVAAPFMARAELAGAMKQYGTVLWLLNPLVFAVAVNSASGAWQSPFSFLVIIVCIAAAPPVFAARGHFETLAGETGITGFIVLTTVAYAAAMLKLYAWLGSGRELAPDPTRAPRAARRAAISLWLRAAAVFTVVPLAIVAGVFRLSNLVILAGVLAIVVAAASIAMLTSGLLGLARANVAGLPPIALCVAAFGGVWSIMADLLAGGSAMQGATRFVLAAVALVITGLQAAGLWAIRELAVARRDRALREAMASRLAWFVGLMLTSVASTLVSPPQTTAGLLRLLTIVFATQVAGLLVLASAYARAAEPLRLASTVDVF